MCAVCQSNVRWDEVKVVCLVTVLLSSCLHATCAPVVVHNKHKSTWDVWHRLCVPAGRGHALDLGRRAPVDAVGLPSSYAMLADEERLIRIRDIALEAKRAATVIKKLMATERLVDTLLVDKLEEPTLAVRGMPQIGDLQADYDTDFVVNDRMHFAFWNVAIATAFVKDSRQSEISYEHGKYSKRYGSLHEKMCAGLFELRSFLVARSYDVDERDLLRQVDAVDLIDASEQTIRHIQHYLVMRDIDKILYSVSKDATTALDMV